MKIYECLWMKIYEFLLIFHLSLFLRDEINNILVQKMAWRRQKNIIWTNDSKFANVYMRHSRSVTQSTYPNVVKFKVNIY